MPLSSLTFVMVARPEVPSRALLDQLLVEAERHAQDVSFIIVANGCEAEQTLALKALVSSVPDLTLVFLGEQQHDDTARLVGIDQAIGDYVVLCHATDEDVADLGAMLAPLSSGYEVLVGRSAGGGVTVHRSVLGSILLWGYRLLFRVLTGITLSKQMPTMVVLSRSAALYLSSSQDAEIKVRSSDLGPAFPAKQIVLPERIERPHLPWGKRRAVSRGIRLIATGSALPLRGVTALGLVGGLLSALYVCYIGAVWLLKPDVQPGWTTTSVQLSVLTFIISVMFFFMAEYLVQILSASPAKARRNLIVRELTSQTSRQQGRLNIVNSEGVFHLGAPVDLGQRAPEQA